MHTTMPVGVDDFAKLREKYYLVDKTLFLCDFLKYHAEVTLFTRPRRFGKTLTMSMLRYFLDIDHAAENRKLFVDLQVADDVETMALQGTRPILFFSLRGCKALDWQAMRGLIGKNLQGLVQQYRFLLTSEHVDAADRVSLQALYEARADDATLKNALVIFLRMLAAHYGRQPVLLLDEYDVPVQSAWESGYYAEAIDFFRVFYTTALKTNQYLDFAVLTGVMRIAKESIFSDLNNLDVDSVLSPKFPEAFGFTSEEVKKLAEDIGCAAKLPEVRAWYDGYRFAGKEIYNPWSVIKYFDRHCVPDTYWVNTSGNAILAELMKSTDREHFEHVEDLMQGRTVQGFLREGVIYSDIGEDQDALYTMLCTTGYLTVAHAERVAGEMEYMLCLPNREMQTLFGIEIVKRYQKGFGKSPLVALMRAMLQGDAIHVQLGLADYLEKMASTFDTTKGKESFYHGFVLGMTAILVPDYDVRSNRESGYGRYDLAAIPLEKQHPGFVLEFKVATNEGALESKAREALQQIDERDYDNEFHAQGIEKVWHYGIAFYGKQVQVLKA